MIEIKTKVIKVYCKELTSLKWLGNSPVER
jgi:hypothetical protein